MVGLSGLVLGCVSDEGRADAFESTSQPSTTSEHPEHGTDTGSARDDAEASSDSSSEAGSPTETSTTGSPTEPDTTTGSGSSGSQSTETGGSPLDPLCISYADHFAECFPDLASDAPEEASYCSFLIGSGADISPPCIVAYQDLFECLYMVDCEDWPISSATGFACPAEDEAVYEACNS